MNWLATLLRPPTFGDAAVDRPLRLLYPFIVLIVAMGMIAAVSGLMIGFVSARFIIAAEIFLLVALWFARRGRVVPATVIAIVVMSVGATGSLVVLGGIHDTALTVLPVAVILASLVLRPRILALTLVLQVSLVTLVVILEYVGVIASDFPREPALTDAVLVSLALLALAVAVYGFMADLTSTLRRVERNQDELGSRNILLEAEIAGREAAEAQLREHRAALEAEVERRTAELRAAEAQVLEQTRLATLGQMGSSLAQLVREPLTRIGESVDRADEIAPDPDEGIAAYHAIIRQRVDEALTIADALINYANVHEEPAELIDLHHLIHELLTEDTPAPVNVDVAVRMPASLRPVFANRLQVKQVLTNLTRNAYQALEGRAGGRVVIELVTQTGSETAFTVRDNGPGIPPGLRESVFRPLVSHRASGIGLGLTIARELAEANRGKLVLADTGPHGTTFALTLPSG